MFNCNCIYILNNPCVYGIFDNSMDINENLQLGLGFLLIWSIAYLFLIWQRPSAERSHKMTSDLALGSVVNLLFWFALYLFWAYALNSDRSFQAVMNLVLDTKIVLVPWAYLSYALVAFGFQLDKVSNGHVDWRSGLIISAICFTFVLIAYYIIGIPAAPIRIP